MKILFKDKTDLTKKLQKELKGHYFVGGRDTLTNDMLECEIISVKTSKVDNKIIKQMPNLKWIINRNYNSNNINLKHCKENNIGVINISYSKNPLIEWIEKIIKQEYYLPYYTVFTDGDVGKLINKKFKYVKHLNLESSKNKIYNTIKYSNTLIIYLSSTPKTRCIINDDIFQMLPMDSTIINLGDGKVINNKDLLKAIQKGKIKHITADSLDSNYRQELLDTGKISYTKNKAWKYKINMNSYIKIIKNHIKSLEQDKPKNVVLEREHREVDVFWE